MQTKEFLGKLVLPDDARGVIEACKSVTTPKSRDELVILSMGCEAAVGASEKTDFEKEFNVTYKVGGSQITEATLVRCKNGIAVNFTEDYMRRRDPDSLIIADNEPTDKLTYEQVFKKPFEPVRIETLEWLKKQDLIVMPFMAGREEYSYPALLIAPKNAAFFALALADLQTFVNADDIKDTFKPDAVIYLAPPFRHTHFNGKQVVVHNRPRAEKPDHIYEMFSYNLYPGPSAKKGIYGFLLDVGEREGWLTAHASAVKITTPYENEIVIMHEGASGSGKSEMSEPIHRQTDGKILVATNTETGKQFRISLGENCDLEPVSDDMAIAHPKMQVGGSRLVIADGENGWFVRVDHIKQYGTEPEIEKLCIAPPEPLLFLNLQGTPNSTCLIWEHTLDSNGRPCPNPRIILPRRIIPKTIGTPVEVDVRSFGVRTPPSTNKKPNYGILGLMHVLPPALAWLWRLVAPRGHNNPSVTDSKGLVSEGVGSYAPFLTGSIIKQANLLLDQIINTPGTRYVLIPNQHVGVFHVGFMPQWISREYIARRGSAKFKQQNLVPARCTILGFEIENLKVDGQFIWQGLLHPEMQPEVGTKGYDKGAKMLTAFFKKELEKFNVPELHPTGRKIIECCLNDATLEEYLEIIPMRY